MPVGAVFGRPHPSELCYPRDIFRLVKAINENEGKPVRMTRANIDRAVALYFARS